MQPKMFKSKHPRELLNEIKWRDLGLSRCDIYYIHGGAPKDTKVFHGDEIEEIGESFLTFKRANIPPDSEGIIPSVTTPHHRIFRITYEGQTIYEK
ncbi:MAG TPA: DUF504 domain-containing protein [Methanocellales archaeon]|nr:DUF504 domain-containing protein [Methanocellales archaeon]